MTTFSPHFHNGHLLHDNITTSYIEHLLHNNITTFSHSHFHIVRLLHDSPLTTIFTCYMIWPHLLIEHLLHDNITTFSELFTYYMTTISPHFHNFHLLYDNIRIFTLFICCPVAWQPFHHIFTMFTYFMTTWPHLLIERLKHDNITTFSPHFLCMFNLLHDNIPTELMFT